MGNRIRCQKRGKGSPKYKATNNARFDSSYIAIEEKQKNDVLRGQVIDLMNDKGKSSVLASILFENGESSTAIAAEGLTKGQEIQCGKNASLNIGNVSQLVFLPEGCPIFNVEISPGDGGKIAKSSGSYALIVSKDRDFVQAKMPSGRLIQLNPLSRATIGLASVGGRKEKPLLKAGKAFHACKAIGRPYPTVRGVAMNPISHPFGGGQHHAGRSKSISRHAPPGKKVGAISSKRTGRRKKN